MKSRIHRQPDKASPSFLLFLALLILAGGLHAAPPDNGFTLALADEFQASVLNTNMWKYRTGIVGDGRMFSTNVSLSAGDYLRIIGSFPTNAPYPTSGGIITRTNLLHGYYEVRCKLPAKPGWHPSFWSSQYDESQQTNPKPTLVRNEVDPFQFNSGVGSNQMLLGLHYWNVPTNEMSPPPSAPYHIQWGVDPVPPSTTRQPGNVPLPNGGSMADWHVYGFEYKPDEVIWFVDGQIVDRAIYPGPHRPTQWMLNLVAANVQNQGIVDGEEMLVDYFRYYTKPYGMNVVGQGFYDRVFRATNTLLTGSWRADAVGLDHDLTFNAVSSDTAGDSIIWIPSVRSGKTNRCEVFVWNAGTFVNNFNTLTSLPLTYQIFTPTETNQSPQVDHLQDGQQWVGLGAYRFSVNGTNRIQLTVPPNPYPSQQAPRIRAGSIMLHQLNLLDHDFDGNTTNGWTPLVGNWGTVADTSGHVYRQSSANEGIARYEPQTWQDYFVRARVRIETAGGYGGIAGRMQDTNNFYYLRIFAAGKGLALLKRSQGVWSTLATVTLPADNVLTNTWFDLLLLMRADRLQGFFNGRELINVRDATFSSGTVGLRTSSGPVSYDLVGTSLDTQSTADTDGDTQPDLLEYALGSDPLNAASAGTVTYSTQADRVSLRLNLPEPAPGDVNYVVQGTTALSGPWTNLARKQGADAWQWLTAGTSRITLAPASPGFMQVDVGMPDSVVGSPEYFLRLMVQTR